MSIDELFNPDLENEDIETDITNEDIFQAVHAKHEALQNLEINGGDDNNNDVIIEKPNR